MMFFLSMEGRFCTSLLHNFTNKDGEGEGIISNKKKLMVLPREGRFFIHGSESSNI
jgi:hypothetical protein